MALFGKGKTAAKGKTPTAANLKNSPLTAYDKAKAEWNRLNGDTVVNQGRFFVLAALMALAVIGMAGAIFALTPLKTVIPYTVQVDKITGETRALGITAERYTPNQQQMGYFIARFTQQLISLDPFLTENNLIESFRFVRGKAIEEFREYMQKNQPIVRIKQDPSLTRTVTINSLQFLDQNIAQVRITTQERSSERSTTAPARRYVVVLHFVIDPPTDERVILQNPIGIYITHFSISEEFGQ